MRSQARDSIVMDRMGRNEKTMMGNEPRDRVRDQSYIKQYNIQSVLAMLKRCQPISRTDVAKLTGMSPTSITRIVTALLNQGLIYETSGEQRSGRGRKATNLRVNADGLYSIGIYLEKSIIRLCVMNFADETLYRGETLVDGECTPEKMARAAKALYDRMPESIIPDRRQIGAVGVCLSGAVNKWQGVVSRSVQMRWRNVDLKSIFSKEFGLTACIENDVKACLIGEKVRMKIPDEVDSCYILVGNGIGLASTSGGVLVRGVKNEAGEIADIPIGRRPDGKQDYFLYHLNEDRVIAAAKQFDPSVHSIDAILWAQKQGHEWADKIVMDFREYMDYLVRMVNGVYNPEKIILAGSICHKLYPEVGQSVLPGITCLGTHYEESCMTGAGLVAMRSAIIERIGQSID